MLAALDVKRFMHAIKHALIYVHRSKQAKIVLRGGRSLGTARHWQPVLKTYMMPFTTSRTFTDLLRPPCRAGGIRGAINALSSSLKSLG